MLSSPLINQQSTLSSQGLSLLHSDWLGEAWLEIMSHFRNVINTLILEEWAHWMISQIEAGCKFSMYCPFSERFYKYQEQLIWTGLLANVVGLAGHQPSFSMLVLNPARICVLIIWLELPELLQKAHGHWCNLKNMLADTQLLFHLNHVIKTSPERLVAVVSHWLSTMVRFWSTFMNRSSPSYLDI